MNKESKKVFNKSFYRVFDGGFEDFFGKPNKVYASRAWVIRRVIDSFWWSPSDSKQAIALTLKRFEMTIMRLTAIEYSGVDTNFYKIILENGALDKVLNGSKINKEWLTLNKIENPFKD